MSKIMKKRAHITFAMRPGKDVKHTQASWAVQLRLIGYVL